MRQTFVSLAHKGLWAGAILALWEISGRLFEIRTDLLPTPSRVFLESGRAWYVLLEHAGVTLEEIVWALLFSISLAVPISLFLGTFHSSDRKTKVILHSSYAVPLVAAAPLLLNWFGFGKMSKILLGSLLSFPPLFAYIMEGLRSPSPETLELMRTMGAGRLQSLVNIRLPASLPYLFRGLKVAMLHAAAGVTVADFLGAESGLGYLMLVAHSKLNTPLLLASLFTICLILVFLSSLIRIVERVLVPWNANQATLPLGSIATEKAPTIASRIKMEKPPA